MEEISAGDAKYLETFDHFAWPLCATLSREGITWIAPDIPEPVLGAAITNYLDLAADETLLAIVAKACEQVPTQSSP